MMKIHDVPAPRSPFDSVDNTLQNAVVLSRRVQDLAARLCGAYPTDGDTGKASKPPSGVFGSMREQAESAAEIIQRAHFALDQIIGELPSEEPRG